MIVHSENDLNGLKEIGRIVAMVLQEMSKNVRPGITTAELDQLGERILTANGARSAPKLVYNFPGATCISINEEVAHGIPGSRIIKPGDIVNIDVSAELDGYFADTGATIAVAPVLEVKQKLCDCSQKALNAAIAKAKPGNRISQVGKVIQQEAQKCGFTVIRNLCGHGIGRNLHEEPREILNYYEPGNRQLFTEGLVVAIESFISTNAQYVIQGSEGWTLKTPNDSLVAQFEHTIIVTKETPIVLTNR